jgi:hypothetical protein
MSIISKLLGSKRVNVKSVLADAQRGVFNLYGVPNPTDAQKLKAYAYLCIIAMAMLNEFGRGRLNSLIDQVAKETAELSKPLRMQVGDLANDSEELEIILAAFPTDLHIAKSTSINGLGAFDALYHAKVKDLMDDLLSHRDGPTGISGYAAIILAAGIFGGAGRDKLAPHFGPAMFQLNEYAAKLLKAA